MITENVKNQNDETLYSSMDMTYAHGQVPLHSGRAKHCTFQIIWDEATGTYLFIIGFYGLTLMVLENQKVLDFLLAKLRDVFVFINFVFTETKRTKIERLAKAREILKTLDLANL